MVAELFDVIEVNIDTKVCRVLGRNLAPDNAELAVDLCVINRGVDECFFVARTAGTYEDGDIYNG